MSLSVGSQGRVLLATRNQKKLGELRRILGPAVSVLGLADVDEFPELPEVGATFADNATAKAMQAAAETGEIALADDSGIAVDALNGMPGVLSARWSGRHGDDTANNALLLRQLADVPDERRGAEFVCALALAPPGREPIVVHGRWRGHIARQPVGDNGFGYDPIFVPAPSEIAAVATGGQARTSAQLSPAEKDMLSHRGLAIAKMLPVLLRLLGAPTP